MAVSLSWKPYNMQQDNVQLLSTRLLDDTLIRKAAEGNLTIECVSFVETKHIHSEALQDRLQSLAKESVIAIFTSQNAVNAVASQLSVIPQWKIFCTGGTTKEYVIKYFGE